MFSTRWKLEGLNNDHCNLHLISPKQTANIFHDGINTPLNILFITKSNKEEQSKQKKGREKKKPRLERDSADGSHHAAVQRGEDLFSKCNYSNWEPGWHLNWLQACGLYNKRCPNVIRTQGILLCLDIVILQKNTFNAKFLGYSNIWGKKPSIYQTPVLSIHMSALTMASRE